MTTVTAHVQVLHTTRSSTSYSRCTVLCNQQELCKIAEVLQIWIAVAHTLCPDLLHSRQVP